MNHLLQSPRTPSRTGALRRAAVFACASGALLAACKGDSKPAAPPPKPARTPAPPISALEVRAVSADVSKPDPEAAYWNDVAAGQVALTSQAMVTPRSAKTMTEAIEVAAAHDGKYIAFRLSWPDRDKSEAGRLGEYSDAAAIQFAVKDVATTPVMMGAPDQPVHIFHWRAQYQRDAEQGKPTMAQLYPNMSVDMYPMEFKEAKGGTPEQQEQFSPGRAEGNPQSYEKTGVDEIVAEGISTSAVQEGQSGAAKAVWKDGWWTLVITRPLAVEGGSVLQAGAETGVAFAVWQGGEQEVGSRKSIMMSWLPTKVL
jgi:hypothetical protein